MGETFQSVGSRALYIYQNEATWGVVNPSPFPRKVRLLPGETIDRNVSILRSTEIRSDRMRNQSVFGNQDPGGGLPFELSPSGWNPFFYHLLGGSVATTTAVGTVAAPSAPSGAASGTGGVLTAATYKYEITALNGFGESLPSTASADVVVASGTTNKVTLTWSTVSGATGYRVYGRTGGNFNLIATLGVVLTYIDTGAVTPNTLVPAPTFETTGHVHVIKGSVDLPVGFSFEKQFLDQPSTGLFIPYYGCRISRLQLNMPQNQIVTGVWDIVGREEVASTTASLLNPSALPIYSPTNQPYSSPQVQIYEGTTLTLLGIARDLQFNVDNSMNIQKGHILGDTLKANLKAGERVTTMSGTFMFKDAVLYNKAVQGTSTALRAIITDGTNSCQIDLPNFKFLPTGTTPKANEEGQLEIRTTGEATPDLVTGTDIIVTLTVPDASITT
jgi:hypothetical protein